MTSVVLVAAVFVAGGLRVYASVVLAAFGLQHRVAVVGASPNLTSAKTPSTLA